MNEREYRKEMAGKFLNYCKQFFNGLRMSKLYVYYYNEFEIT